jgi:hypothetical protein
MQNRCLSTLLISLTVLALIFTNPQALVSYGEATNGLKKATSAGALDVLLQPTPQPPNTKQETQFKVTFLQKGSDKVQPHIDYDFIITRGSKTVFQASNQTGQPGLPIHTAEGVVTIPYKFSSAGTYIVKVPIFGILFNPIKPETADFSIQITS